MPDMLVNLLRLPWVGDPLPELNAHGVTVRRAKPWETSAVRDFVSSNFTKNWADEVAIGFARQPVSIFLATQHGRIVGFAAYECTARAFFGPMGVVEIERGHGIGRALLLAALHGLRELGYVYGIIGGVGPVEFYEKTVGATLIPESSLGIYGDPLRPGN